MMKNRFSYSYSLLVQFSFLAKEKIRVALCGEIERNLLVTCSQTGKVNAYPFQLQRECSVPITRWRNFGKSGATLLNHAAIVLIMQPRKKKKKSFAAAMKFFAGADRVIIQLGK